MIRYFILLMAVSFALQADVKVETDDFVVFFQDQPVRMDFDEGEMTGVGKTESSTLFLTRNSVDGTLSYLLIAETSGKLPAAQEILDEVEEHEDEVLLDKKILVKDDIEWAYAFGRKIDESAYSWMAATSHNGHFYALAVSGNSDDEEEWSRLFDSFAFKN